MDGVKFRKTETQTSLDWKSASVKKKAFNIGISSLKDSVELYARRPIIIPLYNFENPFGVRILETEGLITIAAIVPFDGCSFSDIYLLSNADMNKVMQSNPLVLNDPIMASNLEKHNSAIVDLTNKNLLAPASFVKASASAIRDIGFAPIMYDDGNYSYSSLNLIAMGENWIIAPFELIESMPVPAGK